MIMVMPRCVISGLFMRVICVPFICASLRVIYEPHIIMWRRCEVTTYCTHMLHTCTHTHMTIINHVGDRFPSFLLSKSALVTLNGDDQIFDTHRIYIFSLISYRSNLDLKSSHYLRLIIPSFSLRLSFLPRSLTYLKFLLG
jgi:hypothetical protein